MKACTDSIELVVTRLLELSCLANSAELWQTLWCRFDRPGTDFSALKVGKESELMEVANITLTLPEVGFVDLHGLLRATQLNIVLYSSQNSKPFDIQ